MKFSNMISSLHNSTKATVIACSVLLAMTALALFFLMLFPIKIKEKSAALAAPVIVETTTTKNNSVEFVAATTKEPPHTLSTWAASVETLESTTDPTDIPWYDKLFTTTVETDKYGQTIKTTTTKTTTTTEPAAVSPPEMPETPPPTDPVTLPEPVTDLPAQTLTEVVITESPVTAPPAADQPSEPEIVNAEPVAPEF